jgi:hypothetical protein
LNFLAFPAAGCNQNGCIGEKSVSESFQAGHRRASRLEPYECTMQGDAKVIEYLNKGLRHELTAINQY